MCKSESGGCACSVYVDAGVLSVDVLYKKEGRTKTYGNFDKINERRQTDIASER